MTEHDEPHLVDLAPAVRAAAEGDDGAFRFLYRTVQPGMLRYLRALVGDDAEDVASEAWLQIVRDLRAYRGDGAGFRAWAVSIARNRALDHLHRHRRRPAVVVPVEAEAILLRVVIGLDAEAAAKVPQPALAGLRAAPPVCLGRLPA